MSDAIKWGLLVAAVAVFIGALFALPIFAEFDNAAGALATGILEFVSLISTYINQVKGLVLLLVPTPLRNTLAIMITSAILSFVVCFPINMSKVLYSWIFK